MAEIDVFCYPPDDLAFEHRARTLARVRPQATTEEVEALLRDECPDARLALRDPHPGNTPIEDRVTWYAYRDGRALP